MFIGTIKTLDPADVSSSLPQDEAPFYVNATTYDITDEVIYNRVIYGCLVNGTQGKRPDLFSSRFQTPQYWQVKGPVNAFAAVDGVIAVPTINQAGNIVITVTNLLNIVGVGIFDAFGTSAIADFYNAANEIIQTQTINLSGFNLNSYYEWLFTQPTGGNTNHIFRDFPANTVKVRVTISGTMTRLGELSVIEAGYNIGKALYSSNIRVASRSIYEDDEFGVPRYVKRPSRVNASFQIYGERAYIETLWGRLRILSGDRMIYEAEAGRTITTGTGIVRDITVPIEFPQGYIFSIEFEGVQ